MYPGSLPPSLELFVAVTSIGVAVLAVVGGSALIFRQVQHVVLSSALAVCLLEVILVIGSEVLSACRLYTPSALIGLGWGMSAVIAVVAFRRGVVQPFCDQIIVIARRQGTMSAKLFVAILAFTSVLVLFTGFWTAPNNLDSLAYHLPRIMQWLQAGHIGDFASPYPAQIYLAPGAEQVDALLFVALRSDHAMFLSQWAAFLVICGSVYSVARSLSVSRSISVVGALVALTAPQFIGEAATTQNDLVATSFVVTALAVLVCRQVPQTVAVVTVPILIAGAVVVKPPVALFAVPLVVWYLVLFVRSAWFGRLSARTLLFLAGALGVATMLNVGWMARNVETFGAPLGPSLGLTVTDNHLTAAATNGVKNLGFNIAVPAPQHVDEAESSVLASVSRKVSGVAVDDPRYSFTTDYVLASERNEDRAANVVQFLLGCAGAFTCLAFRETRRRSWPILLVAISGYFTYSGFVRYQTWGGRLMLPLIAECAVFSALGLSALRTRCRSVAAVVVAGVCVLQAVPWAVAQKWRPLIGPSSTISRGEFGDLTASLTPGDTARLAEALGAVRDLKPSSVGLAGPRSYYLEYIWWRELRTSKGTTPRISHVDSAHVSSRMGPEIIIYTWNRPGFVAPPGYTRISTGGIPVFLRS